MTVTLEQAQADLPGIVAKAATGEELFIATGSGEPAVRLVAVAAKSSRLVQHPELKGALTILDHEAIVKSLPPEDPPSSGEVAEW